MKHIKQRSAAGTRWASALPPPPSPPPDESKTKTAAVAHCSLSIPPAVCCCCYSGGRALPACVTRQRRCVFLVTAVRRMTWDVPWSGKNVWHCILAEGGNTSTGLVTACPCSPLPYTTSLWHHVLCRCLCGRSPDATYVDDVCACMCVNRRVSMRGFAFSSFCTTFFPPSHV